MNAHTPGPWEIVNVATDWSVDRDALGSTQSVAICDDDGKIVAFAVDYSNKPFADLNTDHALLIAAAPDLLQACIYLAEGIEACGVTGVYLDQARAAIAKATGEAA